MNSFSAEHAPESPPVTAPGRAGTVASARSRASGPAWIAFGAFWLCFLVDSRFKGLIPMGSLLRMGVPVVLALVALSMRQGHRTLFEKNLYNAVLSFCLVGVLSSLFSVAPELGIIKLCLYMGVMAPLLLCRPLTQGLLPGLPAFRWLRITLLVAMLIVLGQARLGLPGLLTNANAYGAMAVVALPFTLYGLNSNNLKRRNRALLWVFAAMLLAWSSGSRSAAAATLAGILTYYGLRRSSSWTGVAGMGVLVVVVGAVLMASSNSMQEFAYKGDDTLFDDQRQNTFDQTIEAFKRRPLLGYGFGLSELVKRHHVSRALSTGRMSWMVGEFGNSTLAILAGGGLMLAFVFAWVLYGVLGPAYRSLSTVCGSGERRDLQLALIAGLVAMLLHSQSEAWLMAPMAWTTVLFWVYAGMALRCATPARTRTTSTARNAGLL